MAELADIVFDCHHPASLARFWRAALDGYDIAPYDEAELDRLAALGINDPEDDPTVLLEPSGAGLRIWFQRVPEAKSAKNRVHLDIRAEQLDAEVERLESLGAARHHDQPGTGLVVMLDPEGNEFCVIPTI